MEILRMTQDQQNEVRNVRRVESCGELRPSFSRCGLRSAPRPVCLTVASSIIISSIINSLHSQVCRGAELRGDPVPGLHAHSLGIYEGIGTPGVPRWLNNPLPAEPLRLCIPIHPP